MTVTARLPRPRADGYRGRRAIATCGSPAALLGLVPPGNGRNGRASSRSTSAGARTRSADVFHDERRRLVGRLAERVLDGSAGAPVETASPAASRGASPWRRAHSTRSRRAWPGGSSRRAARDELATARRMAARWRNRRSGSARSSRRPARWPSLSGSPRTTSRAIGSALGCALEMLRAEGHGVGRRRRRRAARRSATRSTLQVDLWAAQNAAARLWRQGSREDRQTLAPLMSALGIRSRGARRSAGALMTASPRSSGPGRPPRPGGAA